MGKEIATQVQEAQRVPYNINPKRNMPNQILIKLTKIKHKEKILGTSLLAQWLRIRLPMHGTRVRALVREDPMCHGTTKPMCHSY